MHWLDYIVLVVYFAIMIGIGIYCSRRIHKQEDYLLGGRGFGKLLQTFAAFGAGTGSSDPVNTGRTTFTSGMSGMWSVMYWLFVTPFYCITGVWYRRMRHLTLGDWFVERYQSKRLGVVYTIFSLMFMMLYGSMLFSAIGKVAAPLIGYQSEVANLEYILVPIIGVVVLVYGVMGGLEAAYYTDLIQGSCIILLSILLIPFGLNELSAQFGGEGMLDGFRIMHEQLPPEAFSVVGSTNASEFPIYFIAATVLINLIGVVVQPHFIATGGGSAKTETVARVGLVTGNFLKRFCTVGWVLTALIALALYADSAVLIDDPDKVWGFASRELLGPGLTGLMLACLLAALMSSVDAYMVVGSGLVARNIYAPYINPTASEKTYLKVARYTGTVIVAGAVIISLFMMDVFKQLELTWVFPAIIAATFWVGMYWRRANTGAAWVTVIFSAMAFFILPQLLPRVIPTLRSHTAITQMNDMITTTTEREASLSDVARQNTMIKAWDGAETKVGERPAGIKQGELIPDVKKTGGTPVYWSGTITPVDDDGQPITNAPRKLVSEEKEKGRLVRREQYADGIRLRATGQFEMDRLLYSVVGLNMTSYPTPMIKTLGLATKIVIPFIIMIVFSLIMKPNDKEALDRYYAKMKTTVDPDPDIDRANLEAAYADPEAIEAKKLFPGSNFEVQRPSRTDIVGFVVSVVICIAIIGLAMFLVGIGG
ncbi:MAG: sodium:solute symporter family protein [Planctomycetota bacterium]|nr:sodium:solute symporter family protein [Planctomycetota bacterium]